MKAVFANMSYFTALANPQDEWHQAARHWGATLRCRVVVTEYVLLELGNALVRRNHRPLFLQWVERVRTDGSITYVAASEDWLERGLALFARRPDKEWSLIDCISFEIMKKRKLREALTTDHHFVQAGFKALLRESVP
jgi:uncharacterized protein